MLIEPRLPDGIFSNQKYHFGLILEGLAMEDVGIFYGHLVYITVILYILWPFGICILWPFRIWAIWYTFTILVCCTKENLATLNRTYGIVCPANRQSLRAANAMSVTNDDP
jgi:hypothetical protein